MADPISIVASVATICQIAGNFLAVTTSLRRYIKTAKSAPKEVRFFVQESEIFSGLLTSFHTVAKDAIKYLDEEEKKVIRANLINNLIDQCRVAHSGLKVFARRVKQIHVGRGTTFSTTLTRLLWVIKKPDMQEVQLLMNNAKLSASLLTNVMNLEQALRRGSGREEVKLLRRQLQTMQYTAKLALYELKAYKERQVQYGRDFTSMEDYDMMMENVKEVLVFTTEVIAQTKPQRRERSADENDTSSRRRQSPDPEPGLPDPRPPSPESPGPPDPVEIAEGAMVELSRSMPSRHSTSSPEPTPPQRRQSPSPSPSPSPPPSERVSRSQTYGPRIRDNGTYVSEEIGYWPHNINNSVASSIQDVEWIARGSDQEASIPGSDVSNQWQNGKDRPAGGRHLHEREEIGPSDAAGTLPRKREEAPAQQGHTSPEHLGPSERWRALQPRSGREGCRRRRPRKRQPP